MWTVLVWVACHRGPSHDPGTPAVPRLNRAEYDATVRDLFGTTKRPSVQFPVDESANGFDNQGAALTTTSLHVEGWEAAAVDLIDEMFGSDPEVPIELWFEPDDPSIHIEGEGVALGGEWVIFIGSIAAIATVVDDGSYNFSVVVNAIPLGGIDPRALVRVDDVLIGWADVPETEGDSPSTLVFPVNLTVGTHSLEIGLDNPEFDGAHGRGLVVNRFGIAGPTDPEGARTAAYESWVGCDDVDRACAIAAVARFGAAAWRRPWTEEDSAWAMGLYDGAIDLGEPPDYSLHVPPPASGGR
jgi:Protein of unknown function (DUF1587)